MSMMITKRLIQRTTHAAFGWRRSSSSGSPEDTAYINPVDLPLEALQDLLAAAREVGDSRIEKALSAMVASRGGDWPKVPNFEAFQDLLHHYQGYATRDRAEAMGRKVIVDVDGSALTNPPEVIESRVFADADIRLPKHPLLRVFDLRTQEFLTSDRLQAGAATAGAAMVGRETRVPGPAQPREDRARISEKQGWGRIKRLHSYVGTNILFASCPRPAPSASASTRRRRRTPRWRASTGC